MFQPTADSFPAIISNVNGSYDIGKRPESAFPQAVNCGGVEAVKTDSVIRCYLFQIVYQGSCLVLVARLMK